MPPLTSQWPFDPDTVKLTDDAELACGLRFDLDPEHHRVILVGHGTWWVLPFARTLSDEMVGVRMVPGTSLAHSPVVMLNQAEAMTIASTPACLVADSIYMSMMGGAEWWNRKRGLTPATWDALIALHRKLGGTDDLQSVRAVIVDDALRDAVFDFGGRNTEGMATALARLDSSPQTASFLQYARRAVETYDAPLPLPDLGCWRAAAAAIAYVSNGVATQKGAHDHWKRAAAWEVVNQPPGLDTSQGALPSLIAPPHGTSARLSLAAARDLVAAESELDADVIGDPLWPAVRAMAAEAADYGGLAHMDASPLLKDIGHPERAFTAAVAAAFWRWNATQEPFPELLIGAQMLAAQSGWTEIAETLQSNLQYAVQS
jgi:hypothetical protein